MSKKTTIPDYIVEKYGTNSVEEIKEAKANSERIDTQVFEPVEISKGLSSDKFKARLKELGIEYRKELEERQAVFVISTEDVDRDGDIISSTGIDTTDYNKNPVVLFAHDSRALPIGISLKIYKQNKATKAVVMFFDDEIDKTGTSDTIYRFVKAGGIKGASIGFRPVKARFPEKEEAEKLGMGPYGIYYEKVGLLEWSVVTVPANQNALRSKGLKDNKIKKLEELGLVKESDVDQVEYSMPEEPEAYEIDITELIDEIGSEQKDGSGAIILLKEIKESLDNLNKNFSKFIEKSGPVPRGSDQPEENFDGLLSELEKAINRIKQ